METDKQLFSHGTRPCAVFTKVVQLLGPVPYRQFPGVGRVIVINKTIGGS